MLKSILSSNNVGYPFKICGWMQKYEKITFYWVGVILKGTIPHFLPCLDIGPPPSEEKIFFPNIGK